MIAFFHFAAIDFAFFCRCCRFSCRFAISVPITLPLLPIAAIAAITGH